MGTWMWLITGLVGSIGVLLPLLLAGVKIYLLLTCGRCLSKRILTGKTVIVTGANAGLGLETVKELLMRNARVVMACRNLDKGRVAMEIVVRETGADEGQVVLKHLDLSRMSSVRKFVAQVLAEESRLDILVNNAGSLVLQKLITEDGLESNFATNYFGPFLLTNLLLGLMQRTGRARIVNVAGAGYLYAKNLDPNNLNSENTQASDFTTRESFNVVFRAKLATMLFTRELDRKLDAAGVRRHVTVNSLHPGGVKTEYGGSMHGLWYWNLFMKCAQPFMKTGEEGVQTTIHLAVAAELEGASGGYYIDCAPAKVQGLARDDALSAQLWDASVRAVKLQPAESLVCKKTN